MDTEERESLRKKHYKNGTKHWQYCEECREKYPCDAIRILDAYELLLGALGGILYNE
jgi:hypothetical protein